MHGLASRGHRTLPRLARARRPAGSIWCRGGLVTWRLWPLRRWNWGGFLCHCHPWLLASPGLEEVGGAVLNCSCRLYVRVRLYSIGLLLFWRDSWSGVFFSDPGRVLWSGWCSHGGFDSIRRQQTWAVALTSCHRTRSAAFRELRWDSFFRFQRTAKRSIQRCYQLSVTTGWCWEPKLKKNLEQREFTSSSLQNRRWIVPFTHNLYIAIMEATAISGLTSELLTYCWWRGWLVLIFF
jgi:hypothetical protein